MIERDNHIISLKAILRVIHERPAFETSEQANEFFNLVEKGICEMLEGLEGDDD